MNVPMPFYFVMVDCTLSEFYPSIKGWGRGEGSITRDRQIHSDYSVRRGCLQEGPRDSWGSIMLEPVSCYMELWDCPVCPRAQSI